MPLNRKNRGVSPVIGVILMVALVVILAAVISTFSLGFVDELRNPGPTIAQSSGEFIPQDGNGGGIVLLTHEAGDRVRVEEIEIAVRAECTGGTKQGRILNLPAGAGNAIQASDGQIEGDNIFDERSLNTIDNAVSQVNDGGALLKTRYTAGETMLFRIPKNKCKLTPGSETTVRVIHIPSQSVLIKKQLTA